MPDSKAAGAAGGDADLSARLDAALDGWYAKHFRAVIAHNVAPLSTDDYAALKAAVAAAVAAPTKE